MLLLNKFAIFASLCLSISCLTFISVYTYQTAILTPSFLRTRRQPSSRETTRRRERLTGLHSCKIGNETITVATAPSLIIIGAQKAGTTALGEYLKQHPSIVPGIRPREVHYFDHRFPSQRDRRHFTTEEEFYCLARQRYEQCFRRNELHDAIANESAPPDLTSFDKTPSYIHLQNAAKHIKMTCAWPVKIVAILRDPVDRAYSQYLMDKRIHSGRNESFEHFLNKELWYLKRDYQLTNAPFIPSNDSDDETESFQLPQNVSVEKQTEMLLDSFRQKYDGGVYLRKGMYSLQLQQWQSTFHDSLLVLNYDDLKRDPQEFYRRVLRHANLADFELFSFEKVFAGNYSAEMPMTNTTRRHLEKFFAPYNRQLSEMLGGKWQNVWNYD